MPIRLRVALFVTFYFAVVIVALSSVLTELYERYSYRSFDVTLQAAASSVANRLVEENLRSDLSGIREDIGETIAAFENKIGILQVVVYDSTGREAFLYNDENSLVEQVKPSSFTSNHRIKQFVTMHVHGKPYRATFGHFEIGEQSQGTVVVMGSLSSTRESIDRMRGIAFVVAPITILVVGLGSVLIVRKSLRPLEKMARDIDGIQVERPMEALDVPGTNDEISRVAKSFNALIQRIGALIDTQRNFLLDASHELKTPLTVIQTEIEMLLMKPNLTAKEHENLQQLLSEVEYASKLAVDLIYLTKLETRSVSEMSRTDLGAILDEVVAHHQTLARKKNINLRLKRDQNIFVNADEVLIKRALSNVVDNAIKFSHAGGEVWVMGKVEAKSLGASVTVEDRGEGISKEELPRVFDKFYRTRSSRGGDEKGSGLGLSITKRIMEQHGGTIKIESTSSSGTMVKMKLPAVK